MSRAVSQRIPRREARRRIVDATGRLLRHQRFRELTVEAVMREAGLARTVFYRHFEGLPDLVIGLLEETQDEVFAVADAAAEPGDPEVLYRMLDRTVELFASHGPLLRALDEAAHHDATVEAAYRASIERAVALTAAELERGVASGHVPPLEPEPVARALTMLNGHYLLDVFGDGHGDREVALRTLWTVWSRVTGIGGVELPAPPN